MSSAPTHMQPTEAARLSEARHAVASGELGRVRRAALLSQHEVADACEVSVGTISRWEAGLVLPRRHNALLLADLLDRLQLPPGSDEGGA